MLQTVLGLYLKSLLTAAIGMFVFCLAWLFWRMVRKKDKTVEERRSFLYDLVLIYLMTVPILSFGLVGLLLIVKA